MSTFEPDGYFREPIGPHYTHRGTHELRSFFTTCFSAGGGIALQPCAMTDDGVRCALEYNCVRWGRHDLPPQAGLGVYERGPDGLLAAARVYDDIEPPVELARAARLFICRSRGRGWTSTITTRWQPGQPAACTRHRRPQEQETRHGGDIVVSAARDHHSPSGRRARR